MCIPISIMNYSIRRLDSIKTVSGKFAGRASQHARVYRDRAATACPQPCKNVPKAELKIKEGQSHRAFILTGLISAL